MQIDKNNLPTEWDLNQGYFLLIDKPKDWTSFDVVKYIREQYPGYVKKLGHAGTLDPVATGLLIICTGKLTKSIENFQALAKTYETTFYLGATTPSFDKETDIDHTYSIEHLDEKALKKAASEFEGNLEQAPPAYSAVHVKGKRAYKEARKGKAVQTNPKPVEITEFSIKAINWPYLTIKIVCSKGTYVRSLARDFGYYLQAGAYVSELRRLSIGSYNVANALTLPELDELFDRAKMPSVS